MTIEFKAHVRPKQMRNNVSRTLCQHAVQVDGAAQVPGKLQDGLELLLGSKPGRSFPHPSM